MFGKDKKQNQNTGIGNGKICILMKIFFVRILRMKKYFIVKRYE